jgi:ferrochelatase
MRFSPEPSYHHGPVAESAPKPVKTAILLCNLGTPQAPTAAALRHYLAEFLADPRVVEIPRAIWMLILHGIILRVRPAKSARKYASIWTPAGSPLLVGTQAQSRLLGEHLRAQGHHVEVHTAMRYGQPAMGGVLTELKARGVERVLVLPLYPQYAAATTASVFDAVALWSLKTRRLPEFRFINHYHDHTGYIAALAKRVQEHWAEHGRGEKLVLSFHGVPKRSLLLGDPYHCECLKTARLLREHLFLSEEQVLVTFQSRFGKAEWLQPYTEPSVIALARGGIQSVDMFCPGFTSDCLETLEEIQQEVRDAFLAAGGKTFRYIPCLNEHPAWIQALSQLAEQHLQGWDTRTDPHSPQAMHIRTQQAQAARKLGAQQ